MGGSAFLMAEFIGISYYTVMKHAFLAEFLYYLAVSFLVHFEALKEGLTGLPREELPKFKD